MGKNMLRSSLAALPFFLDDAGAASALSVV